MAILFSLHALVPGGEFTLPLLRRPAAPEKEEKNVTTILFPDKQKFVELVAAAREFLDEARFHVENGLLGINMLNPGHVVLFEGTIPVDTGWTGDFAANLKRLWEIIKWRKEYEEIRLEIDNEKKKLIIDVVIPGESVTTYREPLLDVEMFGSAPIVQLAFDFEAVVKVKPKLIYDELKKLKRCDEIKMSFSEGFFTMEAERDDGWYLTRFRADGEGEAAASYGIVYLEKIFKILRKKNEITIRFSTNKPIEFKYEDGEGTLLRYLLAPRVR